MESLSELIGMYLKKQVEGVKEIFFVEKMAGRVYRVVMENGEEYIVSVTDISDNR